MKERLYSVNVVIVTINGGMDDTMQQTSPPRAVFWTF